VSYEVLNDKRICAVEEKKSAMKQREGEGEGERERERE
jgi:hypothetical protein